MALTDSNEFLKRADATPAGLPASSRQALTRLPKIHAEITDTMGLARFLRSAVTAGAALILLGALALMLAGGAGIQQEFAWSVLVLIAVAAMLRSYIKSTAQALDRAPLRESARDLRAIMFYAGFAWGSGAFLLLGNNPVPITGLCFAVLPGAFLLPLLKDRTACLNFIVPVTLLAAIAILLEPWGDAAVALAVLLLVQSAIAAGLHFSGRPRDSLPAGLSLR